MNNTIKGFVDEVAKLKLDWWLSHPANRIRTRYTNLDPIACLFYVKFNQPSYLTRFMHQGRLLGLSDDDILTICKASDNELSLTNKIAIHDVRSYMLKAFKI